MTCKVSPGQFCEHKRFKVLVKPQNIHRVIFDQRLLLGQWLRSWKRRSANSNWSMRLNINVFSMYTIKHFHLCQVFFRLPENISRSWKCGAASWVWGSRPMRSSSVPRFSLNLFCYIVFFGSQGYVTFSVSLFVHVDKQIVLFKSLLSSSLICSCWETPMFFSLTRTLLFLLTN